MRFRELPLKGSYLIDLEKREDERGFFARYFCNKEFALHNLATDWVQVNTSFSNEKGTIRGMHFQRPPKAEAKLVRSLKGSIFDVIVDLRANSSTYGKWVGKELNDTNRKMMYVPQGFAHGFQTLTSNVELLYFHSEFYSKKSEDAIIYNDKTINISWPIPVTSISTKDKLNPKLNQLEPIQI